MTPSYEQLGPVLVNFSKDGTFPLDEITSATCPEKSAFSMAMKVLSSAKFDLEAEIKTISQKSSRDVDNWISHIKSIQENIRASRKLAHSIVKDAEENEKYLQELEEKQKYVSFVTNELDFSKNLLSNLQDIDKVYHQLVKIEDHVLQHQFQDTLRNLDDAYESYQRILLKTKNQTVQVLELKFSDIRKRTHEELLRLWRKLVSVDMENHAISIRKRLTNENIGLNEIVIGLSYFEDIDRLSKELCDNLDNLIVKPRTLAESKTLPSITIHEYSIKLGAEVDHSMQILFAEIQELIRFLNKTLPTDIIRPLSEAIMPKISERIFRGWLDHTVASSPSEIAEYEKSLVQVEIFSTKIENLQWKEVNSFRDWIENAPKIWLNKRQENMLDWTRAQISTGLGIPVLVESVDTRTFQRNQNFEEDKKRVIATDTQECDAVWDNDEGKKTTESKYLNLHNQQRNRNLSESSNSRPLSQVQDNLEDIDVDAWGWGDDDENESEENENTDLNPKTIQPEKIVTLLNTELENPSIAQKHDSRQKEGPLSEKYWITVLPQSIFRAVSDIYEEYVTLSSSHNQKNSVASAIPRLLNIPIQILAMYRAMSPICYADHPAGNMYRYNDSIWLSKMLKDFISCWKQRTDISQQLIGINKLELDIPIIESFGMRAYRNELNEKRAAINDILGGTQNFFRRDEVMTQGKNEDIRKVISNTRDLAALWENILPYSVWASAIGSIVNISAIKLINDVFDLTDISVDEAERIATTISELESLDDLFIRKGDTNEIPVTSQFADDWMKMKFLGEVLQSNLKDIKFLWFESDLSLYFTADELVELIRLSFEMNYGAKQVIKEIKEKPNPKAEDFLT